MRVRVKVCCISSVGEARLALAAGADALGLVSAMPSGPGVIADELVAEIARAVPPPVATFLLTSRVTADAIAEQHHRTRATTLQLVDHVPPAELAKLRRALPGIKLVQVIHVEDEGALAEALAAAPRCDALLLDSGRPKAAVKELGGTGRRHDWTVSRAIVERAPVPVFLAGGLGPANAAEAIREVRPYGLDICSGVRTDGRLDREKLAAFMHEVAHSG
jgi:phosphoribosylanthranilate isomerase